MGEKAKAAQAKLKATKENLVKKVTVQQAAVKDAKKKSAAADKIWSSYLKDFADQASEDAKAKKKTSLDPWNVALAKAAEPQKGAGGVDCTTVGNKFKTIIYEARNQALLIPDNLSPPCMSFICSVIRTVHSVRFATICIKMMC